MPRRASYAGLIAAFFAAEMPASPFLITGTPAASPAVLT
jgi:hypothetical protein